MGLLNQTPGEYYNDAANYGSYQFITLDDIISNFMMAYVGEGKLINKVKRTDVAFHTQRAIQELSFDTLPSTKSIEIEMGPALTMTLPQDYVNYVNFSFTDNAGIQHIIYPTRDTNNPTAPLQDSNDNYLFDQDNNLLEADNSLALERFKSATYPSGSVNKTEINEADIFDLYRYGNRYGLEPEKSQGNGVFYIDQNKGVVRFSSNLVNQVITLKYVSDGLGTLSQSAIDSTETLESPKIHKFAEETVYKYLVHAILSTRANVPEYQVARYKKELTAAKRNAKLRLSNLKISELAQVMRNQSKWIKH